MDYDVWYGGMIIGNIKANNDAEALRLALKIYKGGKLGNVSVARS